MSLVLCELADASAFGVESLSPFCLKAHRALRASGLGYQSRRGGRPAAFQALNPTAQVPVLLEGERVIPDSTAILRRVVQLAPDGLEATPEAWLWEELADTALNGFLVAARWADDRNWPAVRAAYFGDVPWPVRPLLAAFLRSRVVSALVARDVWRAGPQACWDRFEALLDDLDARAPVGGFWLGERLSVADVALFAQVHSLRTPLTPWQRVEVEDRPRLRAWLDRVDAATRAGQLQASTPLRRVG